MADGDSDGAAGEDAQPKMQVIVLGSGGGPREDNTTAFLVRSINARWAKGSLLAVDAGTHLAAISKLLEQHPPPEEFGGPPFILREGPLAGLEVPNRSADANAGYIIRTLVDSYLITHPHLDHIAGFVVNTSSLPGIRPKRLAGLPTTIDAFKQHIFNNVIWPNLSDENNGVGLVTYMRLVEGGTPYFGDGAGKGYLEICDGLSVKTWSVSHGHCIERHSHRGSSAGFEGSPRLVPTQFSINPLSHSHLSTRTSSGPALSPGHEMVRTPSREHICVYDSSAYFIREIASGKEVLIFGDVEPDSVSLSPRNLQVWNDAAPKIVAGQLGGIFIECSYDDSRSTDTLFGHLTPYYLMQELKVLATQIHLLKKQRGSKDLKRERSNEGGPGALLSGDLKARRQSLKSNSSLGRGRESPVSPRTQPRSRSSRSFDRETTHAHSNLAIEITDGILDAGETYGKDEYPLKGVKIVVIHMKERLDDGPDIGDIILHELLEHEAEDRLGCDFVISKTGQALYF